LTGDTEPNRSEGVKAIVRSRSRAKASTVQAALPPLQRALKHGIFRWAPLRRWEFDGGNGLANAYSGLPSYLARKCAVSSVV